MSNKSGMLASRTPDRYGKSFRRVHRPKGRYRTLQKRARRHVERDTWRQDHLAA